MRYWLAVYFGFFLLPTRLRMTLFKGKELENKESQKLTYYTHNNNTKRARKREREREKTVFLRFKIWCNAIVIRCSRNEMLSNMINWKCFFSIIGIHRYGFIGRQR